MTQIHPANPDDLAVKAAEQFARLITLIVAGVAGAINFLFVFLGVLSRHAIDVLSDPRIRSFLTWLLQFLIVLVRELCNSLSQSILAMCKCALLLRFNHLTPLQGHHLPIARLLS